MKTETLKNFMVPLSEYATEPENSNLYEAVLILEKVRENNREEENEMVKKPDK